MNTTLIADLIANIIDGKRVEVGQDSYLVESYSEDDKIVLFMNAEHDDESHEFMSIVEDPML